MGKVNRLHNTVELNCLLPSFGPLALYTQPCPPARHQSMHPSTQSMFLLYMVIGYSWKILSEDALPPLSYLGILYIYDCITKEEYKQ